LIQKKHGKLTASGVLDLASNPKHPLHKCFEWDDKKAAVQFRLNQARVVIKQVNAQIDDPAERIVHVPAVMGDVVNSVSEFEAALTEALSRLKQAEQSVGDLQHVASNDAPDKVAFLSVALKSLETAGAALNKLH